MKIALTPAEMAYCDRTTIDGGVPSVELMCRVARAVYDSREWRGSVYIICGKGNNGGDGLALADIMEADGIHPKVFLVESPTSTDALYYLNKLREGGFSEIYDAAGCDYDCDILVDCIFGTGFKGSPDGRYADAIKKINSSRAYTVCVDIPSGLDGANGLFDVCVKGDETLTVQYPKCGLYLNDGKDMTGKLTVVRVGIGLHADGCEIVEESDVAKLFPKRRNNSHKGSYGKSAIMGGCDSYMGAVKLAAAGLCALRSGGGLNMLIVPSSHIKSAAQTAVETTVFGMSEKDGAMVFDRAAIDCALKSVDAIAIGMGIGGGYEETLKIIRYIVAEYPIKVLIDADGLNALSLDLGALENCKAQVILTPHIKEMSRLCGKSVEEIKSDPINTSKEFAEKHNVTVLLKGASSVISDGKRVCMMIDGGAELSKGGSGDTLSGVTLGLLSQGNGAYESAYAAAYITARTARKLADEYSEYGVLPSDVSRELARIIKENNDYKKENIR